MEEDAQLIDAYLAGSEEAIGGLVTKYQRQVYALIYRMVNDIESAKDLTQQTFLNALKGLKGFRRESSFKTWLYQIAINTSRNHVKQRRYDTAEIEDSIAGNDAGPLAALMEKERAEQIRKGVDRLPERQRLALVLRVYQGMSCAEAAQVMGCTEGAVKAHYHHAVKKLRGIFKERGYEIRT